MSSHVGKTYILALYTVMPLKTMPGSELMIKVTKITIMEFLENPKNLFSVWFVQKINAHFTCHE